MNNQTPYNLNSPFGVSPSPGDYSQQQQLQQRMLFSSNQPQQYLTAPFNTLQPMFYGMPSVGDAAQQVDNMMALQRQQQLLQAAFNTSQPSANVLVAPHGQLPVAQPQQSALSGQPQIQQQLYATGMPFSVMQPQQNSTMVANSFSALQQESASGQPGVQHFYSPQQPSSQQTFYIQQQMPPLQSSQSSTTTTIQIIQQQQQQQLPSQQQQMGTTMPGSSGSRANFAAEADTCQRVPSIAAASSMPARGSPLKQQPSINNQLENERLLRERGEAEMREKKEHDEREKQRIQEELKRRKESARELAESITEKLRNFPEPLHFACCHTLSKLSNFLPFPSECASTASTLPCFDVNRIPAALSNADQNLSQYLARVLTEVDAPSKQIVLQHDNEELAGLDGELLTPLLGSVLTFNPQAFNTDPSTSTHSSNQLDNAEMEKAFDREIQEMVDQVSAGQDMFSQFLQNRPADEDDEQPLKRSQHKRDTSSMVSVVGKQPKSAPARRKRDMVESLYDSLTGYFDPAKSRRSRATRGVYSEDDGSENENRNDEAQGGSRTVAAVAHIKGDDDDDVDIGKFFDKRGRKRARASFSEENRPPTPTEIIQQREREWSDRQRQREEKYRRRQQESTEDYWNNEAMAESESYCKFTNLIDQIFDQVEDQDLDIRDNEAQEFLIDRNQLDELRTEAQKLKSWKRLNKVNTDRLVKLLTVLEKNIRDVLSDEGSLRVPVGVDDMDDDSDEAAYRELIDERLIRSVDAACVALIIMTSAKMPKQVLIEDAIERATQLAKQYLQHVIYPAVDASQGKTPVKARAKDAVRRRRENFTPTTATIYSRLVDLIDCFAELARFHTLNDSVMIQFSSLATPPFFVDTIAEVQVASIKLLSTIFAKCSILRRNIIFDLLNSLHRLPSTRHMRNCYKLSNTEYISNFSVLILQLIQSVVKLPQLHNKRSHAQIEDADESIVEELGPIDDKVVLDSYEEAKMMAAYFLGGFLTKCTAKSEDDYRRLFEQFLQDLLSTLYRPEWPVSELMLTVLGNILVKYTRTKTYDLSLRVACLDYLGTVTARLRKDRVAVISGSSDSSAEKNWLDLVVRGICYDEQNDVSKGIEEIEISHVVVSVILAALDLHGEFEIQLSSTEKIRKLEQALIDYIIGTKGDGDVSVEYVVTFYAAEWYRETVLDVEVMKQRYQSQAAAAGHELTPKEAMRGEKKLEKIKEKGRCMKEFILGLLDRKHLKKRAQYIARTSNIIIDSDAAWVVKYLASKKELSQSFDIYLNKILEGFNPDMFPAAIRSRAMKCLSQIVEADHHVLMIPEVSKIVQDRLIDANPSVREATFELIGKYLVCRPDLLEQYYTILISRIKDTSVSVRKRVIRILKDIVEKQPRLEKGPAILARICQRINDEESVKKLCLETFQNLWFQPLRETEKIDLDAKIVSLVDTVNISAAEGSIDQFETLISAILKNTQDRAVVYATKQMVDALVDNVLSLDSKIAKNEQKMDDVEKADQSQLEAEKLNQSRLIASLISLSVFAKAKPEFLICHAEVFLPYLSMSASSQIELRVLNQMISMLELIVPLMDHPSEVFLKTLDQRLNDLVKDGGMIIIAAAISCMSAAHSKFKRVRPGICSLFMQYLRYLSRLKNEMEEQKSFELPNAKRPTVLRSLYSLGLMSRYFDFDHLLRSNPDTAQAYFQHCGSLGSPTKKEMSRERSDEEKEAAPLQENVYDVLFFFTRSRDSKISLNALIALGQFGAGCPSILEKTDLKSLYLYLLRSDAREGTPLKAQVLKNLSCFLKAEEDRAVAKNAELRKEREQQKGAEDLKEMELGSSGLSSAIIQVYWEAILCSYFHPEASIRADAAQVVGQTLEQGLVTPGSSIPALIAMTTDSVSGTRARMENLLKDIDAKYPGMVSMKGVLGIRYAFKLQKQISQSKELIRGIRSYDGSLGSLPKSSNETQSLLSGLYTNIRGKRENRRNFLAATLRLFSDANSAKEKPESAELAFIVDNLANFHYQVFDEPLFIINQSEAIISLVGQNILSSFKRPNASGQMEEDDDYSVEVICGRLPTDKQQLHECRKTSQACSLLLQLKSFLMKMYALKEDKVKEYSPSEAAKIYEKPMTRRNVHVFAPDTSITSQCTDDEALMAGEARTKLAEHFHNFFKMLLSLDTRPDDDDDIIDDSTTANTEQQLKEDAVYEETLEQTASSSGYLQTSQLAADVSQSIETEESA